MLCRIAVPRLPTASIAVEASAWQQCKARDTTWTAPASARGKTAQLQPKILWRSPVSHSFCHRHRLHMSAWQPNPRIEQHTCPCISLAVCRTVSLDTVTAPDLPTEKPHCSTEAWITAGQHAWPSPRECPTSRSAERPSNRGQCRLPGLRGPSEHAPPHAAETAPHAGQTSPSTAASLTPAPGLSRVLPR